MTTFLHFSYTHEDFAYQFALPSKLVLDLPLWLADDECPPLSPAVAIDASRAAVESILAEILAQDSAMGLRSCRLMRGGTCHGGYRASWWFYLVSWIVPDLVDGSDGTTFAVPVLFDGRVPDPVKVEFEDRFDTDQWGSWGLSAGKPWRGG